MKCKGRVGVYMESPDEYIIRKHCKDYGKKLSPFLVSCALKYIRDNVTETPIIRKSSFFERFGR